MNISNADDKDPILLREEMKEMKGKFEKMEKYVENKLSNNIWEDRLLAALYSDIEYLKDEICEKNMIIGTLLHKDAKVDKKILSEKTQRNSNELSNELLNCREPEKAQRSNEKSNEPEMRESNDNNKLQTQLQQIRSKKNDEFNKCNIKNINLNTNEDTSKKEHLVNQEEHESKRWPKNTILIAGDSMLYGIDERKLKKNTKVRVFPGSPVLQY